MITMTDLLTDHPFLAGLRPDWLEHLSYQAKRIVYHTGDRLFSEGANADRFWLIRSGRVGLDLRVPGRGEVLIDSLGPGTVLGWSWVCSTNQWRFGAVAAEQTLAVVFNAPGVLRLCDEQPELGYEMARRFLAVVADRLHASRTRLLDVYGYDDASDLTPLTLQT